MSLDPGRLGSRQYLVQAMYSKLTVNSVDYLLRYLDTQQRFKAYRCETISLHNKVRGKSGYLCMQAQRAFGGGCSTFRRGLVLGRGVSGPCDPRHQPSDGQPPKTRSVCLLPVAVRVHNHWYMYCMLVATSICGFNSGLDPTERPFDLLVALTHDIETVAAFRGEGRNQHRFKSV